MTFYHLLSGNGDGSSGDRITPETDPQEGTSRKSNATDATAEDRLMIVDEDEHEEGSGPSKRQLAKMAKAQAAKEAKAKKAAGGEGA